jgi:MFS family permease
VFRYFYMLVVGHVISSFGIFLNMVALNLFAYEVTESALHTGLLMALRLAASFFAGLVGGKAVVRYNRKTLMIASDLTQGLGLLLLVLAPVTAQPQLLYGLVAVFGTCSTLSGVSLRSSVPELVGQDHRVRANGLLVTGRSLAMVLGFASAGLVVAWSGYQAAFVLDAVTFFISALNLAWLPLTIPAAAQADASAAMSPGFFRSHHEAVVFLKMTPMLLVVVCIRAVDAFGSASHNVSMPVYANIANPRNPADFMGHFWAAWAVGSLLAYRVLARLLKRQDGFVSERAFALGTCLMSTFFILVFTGLSLPLMLVIAVAAGLSDGFTEIAYTSRLQAVGDEQRGFLFGFSAMAESFGLGLGMVLSAWLLERHMPLFVVGLSHGIAVMLAVLFLFFIVSRARLWTHPVDAQQPQLVVAERDAAPNRS